MTVAARHCLGRPVAIRLEYPVKRLQSAKEALPLPMLLRADKAIG